MLIVHVVVIPLTIFFRRTPRKCISHVHVTSMKVAVDCCSFKIRLQGNSVFTVNYEIILLYKAFKMYISVKA